jgi:catechol 2,3-dioxygenase-like lactoylglutathione lyase family enzyme
MSSVLDHVTVAVSELERSRRFYAQALAPLGFSEQGPWSDARREIAFGGEGSNDFAISDQYRGGGTAHIAFRARSREAVDAFHAAALAAGGRDNGAPGFRPEYSDTYYGAFALDPDGHNVEAVWHAPERDQSNAI